MEWELTSLPEQQLSEAQPESLGGSALRNVARTAARGAESLLGLPGDIAGGLLGLTNLGIRAATGKESPLPESLPIPTSETIRKYVTEPISQNLPAGYLEPHGEAESFSDAIFSDLVPLLVPVKGKIPFAKAATAAGLGNIASWATKEVGGGEGAQAGAKIGTMLLSSLGGGKGLVNTMNDLYSKAESSIPKNAIISAKSLEPKLDKLLSAAKSGIPTPTKDSVGAVVSNIKKKIKNGVIPVSEAWEIKKNLNELSYGKSKLRGIEKSIPSLISDFNGLLETAGKSNPAFIKSLREADDIYRGLNSASVLKSFVNKNVNIEKLISPLTGVALGLYPLGTLGSISGLFGVKGGVNLAESLLKSPAIRKYYFNIASAVAKNNTPVALKNIHMLDKQFQKNSQGVSSQEEGEWELTNLGSSSPQ